MQFSTRMINGVTTWRIMHIELHEEYGGVGFGHIFSL
jgi:hypothetical protein